jgi:hypothetical protein
MTTFYDQDAEAESAVNPTYDPAMAGTVHLPDRRSVFRREADRGIIAEQAETIELLEGRIAMRDEKIMRLQYAFDSRNWKRWAGPPQPADGDS